MAKIIIFRGKSATGKTVVSSIIEKKLNTCILRKDDIFDPLSTYFSDNSINNKACYDILANMIQQNIDNSIDVIVDIALPHTPYYNMFLSKINLANHIFISFLCDCSDKSIWLSRWKERLLSSLPNQYFKTIDEIENHYEKMNIELLENENYIDSCNEISKNIDKILFTISKQ